mmetsp:Transcript_107139/g.332947  ORF Transcript_107139/g.332947 Transcript_107139/m.332947 type:complete len:201 (-) Transcript_107139:658-1260(-)
MPTAWTKGLRDSDTRTWSSKEPSNASWKAPSRLRSHQELYRCCEGNASAIFQSSGTPSPFTSLRSRKTLDTGNWPRASGASASKSLKSPRTTTWLPRRRASRTRLCTTLAWPSRWWQASGSVGLALRCKPITVSSTPGSSQKRATRCLLTPVRPGATLPHEELATGKAALESLRSRSPAGRRRDRSPTCCPKAESVPATR